MAQFIETQESKQEKHVDDEVQQLPLDVGTDARRKRGRRAQNPAHDGGYPSGTDECGPGHPFLILDP
jgi:hypothetical protein